jgi:hypothetical protein
MEKSDPPFANEDPPAKTVSNQPRSNLAMEKEMVRLCEELSIPAQDFLVQIDSWLKVLDNYIKVHKRLLYSRISDYVFGLNTKQVALFESNVLSLMEYVLSMPSVSVKEKKRKDIILKFYDHANLAVKQYRMFARQQKDIEVMVQEKIDLMILKIFKNAVKLLRI